ncbi:carbohydrate ABC transporter permease [Saccharopolyspora shandongensis]|uniref:carbohydrate ABC transporter permease n=1 Tax=Saccharopolyspora shandongensis TaxID=418495 RepID=UPI0034010669
MASTVAKPGPARAFENRTSGSASRRPAGRRADQAWAYLLIAPTTLGLGVFYLWPIGQTFYYSFTKTGPFGGNTWIGTENYRAMLDDPLLPQSIANTLLYAALQLVGIVLAIVVATLLNQRGLRGRSVYRALYFLPVVTMPVAVAMQWRWIYNGDFGLLNYLLSLVGVQGPRWITDPSIALYAVAVIGIWTGIGYNLVIFLAGLQGIPAEYYEAAAIDGAGPVRTFFRITVPLLSPSIFFATVLMMINALQMFDLVYVMMNTPAAVNGSPALPGVRTIAYLFYEKSFIEHDLGFGAAIAFVMLAFILVVTIIQFRLQKRWVHYA